MTYILFRSGFNNWKVSVASMKQDVRHQIQARLGMSRYCVHMDSIPPFPSARIEILGAKKFPLMLQV